MWEKETACTQSNCILSINQAVLISPAVTADWALSAHKQFKT